MMKKLTYLMLPVLFMLGHFSINAQTPILEEVFTDVTVETNVQYAQNYSVLTGSPQLSDLEMDVYQPVGDTSEARPLILLTHAGSFLPKGLNTLPLGNKGDSAIVEMCTQFAKRGWVCASLNYRLGWNPTSPEQDVRASTIIQAVFRASQDSRAAIRYFRQDAATDNNYKIDPYRIAMGGSNSGGYIAITVGSLNKPSEIDLFKFLDDNGNPYIDREVLGGFYGQAGQPTMSVFNHPGYSSEPQLILNMGGAVGDPTWIDPGEAPIVSFHGVADPLTPYETGIVTTGGAGGIPIIEVSGSHDVQMTSDGHGNLDIFHNANFTDDYTIAAQSKTTYEGLFPFDGMVGLAPAGYEPWAWYDCDHPNADTTNIALGDGCGSAANPMQTKTIALTYIDTIMNFFAPRAVVAFENIDSAAVETADPEELLVNVQEVIQNLEIKAYPNPASDFIIFENNEFERQLTNLAIYDLNGKLVRSVAVNPNQTKYQVDVQDLIPATYFIRVGYDNKSIGYIQFIKQ